MGTAKLIASAIGGGAKMFFKAFMAIRKGKKMVKKGQKTMREHLENMGVPPEQAKEIADAFSKPGMDMLKIRNIMRFASKEDWV